jgi:hypothetical protein
VYPYAPCLAGFQRFRPVPTAEQRLVETTVAAEAAEAAAGPPRHILSVGGVPAAAVVLNGRSTT